MAARIYIFHILFLFPMWISKTLQPIYWEQQGQLKLFSASYVAMALAGACSIFYARILARTGAKVGLSAGFLLYGIGLVLRAFPEGMAIAVGSGLTAGVGASCIGLSLKSLVFQADEGNKERIILHSDNIMTVSQSLGAFVAGGLVTLLALYGSSPYATGLLISGLLVLTGLVLIPSLKSGVAVISTMKKEEQPAKWQLDKTDVLLFTAFIISGACWALILPMLPVYLKDMHFSDAHVGLVMSAGVIGGLLFKNIFILLFKSSDRGTSLLIFALLCMLAIFAALSALKYQLTIIFAVSVIAMYTFRTICSLLISYLEMDIAQRGRAEHIFGLTQTAFLTGDILGGIALPYSYESRLLSNHPLLMVALLFLSYVLVYCGSRVGGRLNVQPSQ
ncbi:MFS transporter [Candidatus Pantoea soli]|uniref:MFS transporter n=1 Tax=Candidatus Pantoea soli TaxID=3098669 RepID=A0A518XJ78_9GAMM|nr:MFS transporter [Pantoea soli]QDY44250.1 MFS transporter [Pantoea soli]